MDQILSSQIAAKVATLYERMELVYDIIARQLDFTCQGCPELGPAISTTPSLLITSPKHRSPGHADPLPAQLRRCSLQHCFSPHHHVCSNILTDIMPDIVHIHSTTIMPTINQISKESASIDIRLKNATL
jgi:hypothetical protein